MEMLELLIIMIVSKKESRVIFIKAAIFAASLGKSQNIFSKP
jgi:hypothetical protein